MCRRYWIDESIEEDLKPFSDSKSVSLWHGKRDINPSQIAPVIGMRRDPDQKDHRIELLAYRWGFPSYDGKLVINARSESVMEKKMFHNGILHHRIVIPAAGFYEWNPEKEKSSFYRKKETLYFAGIAEFVAVQPMTAKPLTAGSGKISPEKSMQSSKEIRFDLEEEGRFVILTTAANQSVRKVHDRMPMILERDQIEDWILDEDKVSGILNQIPAELIRESVYEQMSLFE